jgi:iron complex transport system substrate-binding protein
MKTKIVLLLLAVILVAATKGFVGDAYASKEITVVDDLGRTVIVTRSDRIVSISPSCTEILYALGLGDRIIAVDRYSDYPPEAIAKQKISKAMMPDPEEVAALNPDLVFYYHWGPWDPTLEKLSGLGLTVIAIRPYSLDDIIRDIKLIGNATGKSQEAASLASSLAQRINEIKSKTAGVAVKPKVYIEYWYPPPWTFGPNTWGHQLIELAGGINAFGDAEQQWIKTTDEEVIARNPDVIISLLGTHHYASLEDIKGRPGWYTISAVAKGAVYTLDENLFIRFGPRLINGLETLAKILHPELFGGVATFTFVLNATKLKSGVEIFNISDLVKVDILVIKSVGNGTLTVTIQETGPEVSTNRKLVGKYLAIDSSVPAGLVFTLRIYYNEDQLRAVGVSEDSLKIYVWDEGKQRWTATNSAVNKDENYVEATVTHLSYFAVMGETTPPLWNYPIPLWLYLTSLIVVIGVAGVAAYITHRKGESAK